MCISQFISQFVSVCGVAISDMLWQLVTRSWPVNHWVEQALSLRRHWASAHHGRRHWVALAITSNSQCPFPTLNRCLLYYLVLALVPPQPHVPLATSRYSSLRYVASSTLSEYFRHTLKSFTFCIKILYYIYSCTFDSRTFVCLQRIPCLYHFVFTFFAAGIQHMCWHSPSILASRRQ